MPLNSYLKQLALALKAGNSTEHTHRPALKSLIESLGEGLVATNEPKRIACGAPDFIVTRNHVPLGYIEAKDVGTDLDEAQDSEQLTRYRASLRNLILTDYLEFRLYRNGELVQRARLGTWREQGVIKADVDGSKAVTTLLTAFVVADLPSVGSARELAQRMAWIAQLIRDLIRQTFSHEGEQGDLHAQYAAFRKVLLADLEPIQFADMYAQTLCYGLFAARCNHVGAGFTREHAASELPRTNPFLRKLFAEIAGINLDDRIAWAVDDLADLLARADMAAVLEDFGSATQQEDPVVHFYETFLSAYDPRERERRGVYYTPEPVVSYIVRSVDAILKKSFGLELGLADSSKVKIKRPLKRKKDGTEQFETIEAHRVQILDPATGTGTFLYFVIAIIREALRPNAGLWQSYVTAHLLPRVIGFELLMAPYAVAHMKLGLELKETGYDFSSDERLRVYLTNTLEEAHELAGLPLFTQWLSQEAMSASEVKKSAPIMVVLGNPPYSGLSVNTGAWIAGLLRGVDSLTKQKTQSYFEVDGKPLKERKHWLNDDYVKFIRFAQWRIEQTGYGVLAFVTNHGYLDNPTFRGMRQSLMETFNSIFVLDLHGNSKKKEKAPDGGKDVNVFDIQQGVAIGLFIKSDKASKGNPCEVSHAEVYGLRESKYEWLWENDALSTKWELLKPQAPFYLFKPQDVSTQPEYDLGWKITEVFGVNTTGIVTARDHLAVDYTREALMTKIEGFLATDKTDDQVRETYFTRKGSDKYPEGDTRGWKLPIARKALRESDWQSELTDILYRPFDVRAILFSDHMVDWPRGDLMSQMAAGATLAISTTRSTEIEGGWEHVFCTSKLIQHHSVSLKEVNYLFPLYVPSTGFVGRRHNLSSKFIAEVSRKLSLTFVQAGRGDLETTFGPEDILEYMYAVFYSPTYRARYAQFLKNDFPRLPLTSDPHLFRALCSLGRELVALHLMNSTGPNLCTFPASGSNRVEKVEFKDGRVYINRTQYFEGVPEDVWNYTIGGYQVALRWLKDRKDRSLSHDDFVHYMRTIGALAETIRLQDEIETAMSSWPFKT